MNIKSVSVLKDSVFTTIAGFGAQFLTFVVSAFIASEYGASSKTDAFFYALSVVLVFTASLSGVLKSSFTSVFHRFALESKEEEKKILSSFYFAFLSAVILLWVAFNLCFWILLKFIKIPGFIDNSFLNKILFELSFLIIFSGLVDCISTIYNSYQKFIIPTVSPIIRSIVFLAFVRFTINFLGVESLAIGNSLAELAHFVILIFILKSRGLYFGLKATLHPAVKRMFKISVPSLLSNATTKINEFIDSSFMAPLLVGGVTVLNYSSKISSIPTVILSGGFLTVILSHWSFTRSKIGIDDLGKSIKKSLLSIAFVFIPILCLMFVLRLPLVSAMYQRKNFSLDLSEKTALLVGIYLIGILPLMLGRVLTRAFLAIEDTWTPFWVGNIRMVINIAGNFLFVYLFGYAGIPVSTCIASFVLFTFMIIRLRKKINLVFNLIDFKEVAKMLISGLLLGVVVNYLFAVVRNMGFWSESGGFIRSATVLVSLSFIGVVVYTFFSFILKLKILSEIIGLLKKRV